MSAFVRGAQRGPGSKSLLAIAFALATVLGLSALAPASAFAVEQADGVSVEVGEGVVLVTSVDDGGVLRVEQVVIEGAAIYSVAEGEAEAESVVLSPEEAADVIDLQSEEVLVALAAAHDGWYQSSTGDWFYFVSGKWVTGWKKIDGYWYCFRDNGIMRTGWYSDGTYWFYLRPSYGNPTSGPQGSMVTGWASIDGYWYYFDLEDGDMRHGWISLGGSWYYLRTATNVPCSGPEGGMVTDWAKIDSNWYYFNSSGVMQTGRLCVNGYEYYLSDTSSGSSSYGAMLKGFQNMDGFWYYYYDPRDKGAFTRPVSVEGALVKSNTFRGLTTPSGLASYGEIDSSGHAWWTLATN